MDNKDLFGTKYPISKHGKQCLTNCLPANTKTLHPTTLDYIGHDRFPYCAVDEWTYFNEQTGKKTNLLLDFCMAPTQNQEDNKDIEMNILVPQFNFSPDYFLKMYYKIYSFDNAIKWITDKNSSPIFTRIRILDSALANWGNTEEFIITDDLIAFFIVIIKKIWIRDIYNALSKYISVNNNKISIANSNTNNHTIEKTNYLLKKITDTSTLYTILSKYHQKYESTWKSIGSHTDNIKQFMIDYLEKKLIKTINK